MSQIKVKKIKISNTKISSKIVLISDIHYYSKNDVSKLNNILDSIKELNPNYICVLGDTCDQAKILDEDVLVDWLKKLAKISKVIMVYGNHDLALYSNHTSYFNKELFGKIQNIPNLYLLDNELIEENNICFIGIKMDYEYFYEHHEDEIEFVKHYNKIIKKLKSKTFNILLSHSPIALTKDKIITKLNDYKNIDLVLCGHMHGGITPDILRPILKTRGLISPNKHRLFIKNAYGNFKIDNISFIVTSGITKLPSKFKKLDKLFKSEIVVIELED